MELIVILIAVGAAVAAVMALVGVARRDPAASEDTPHQAARTDTGTPPPPEPDRPVPGSRPDRERKGHTDEDDGSPVVGDP